VSDERRQEDASFAGRAPPPLEDDFLVMRGGERPRKRWLPVAGSAILALLALVNLRALVKRVAA
jgi:hypothetical protein